MAGLLDLLEQSGTPATPSTSHWGAYFKSDGLHYIDDAGVEYDIIPSGGAGSFTTLSATGNVSFDGGTFVFNESGADKDFRAEGVGEANLLFLDASAAKVGIGTATPSGRFSVYSGASGATVDANADDVVIQNSGNAGISILSPNASFSQIFFGSASDATGAKIAYKYNDLLMSIGTTVASGAVAFLAGNGNEAMRIFSNGNIGVGITTTPDGKLHIQSASAGAVSAGTSADELILEGSGNTGMTILTGDALEGRFVFGAPTDDDYAWFGGNYNAGSPYIRIVSSASPIGRFDVDPNAPRFRYGSSGAGSGIIHADQASATGAVPALYLDQADVSEEFIRYVGTSAASDLTQSLVRPASVSTVTPAAYVRVYIDDTSAGITPGYYYVEVNTLT